MKPVSFKEQNVVFAENQKEYIPLPALRFNDPHGTVVFCSKLTWWERIRVLFTGRIWITLLTFSDRMVPSYLSTNKKDHFEVQHKQITKWKKLKTLAYNLLKQLVLRTKSLWS